MSLPELTAYIEIKATPDLPFKMLIAYQ